MDVFVYRFPRLEDGVGAIDELAYKLETRRWQGGTLSPEELDWLDWANTVTLGVYNQRGAA